MSLIDRIHEHSGFKTKDGRYRYHNMTGERLAHFARLEARIAELGGVPPKPWAHIDGDIVLRNLQLIEYIEELEDRV